jgi:serine/threonine protein kinase
VAVSQRVVGGVSIDERLSVTAYGAVHKAHTGSRRDLRVLVVDPKLAASPNFETALLDDGVRMALTSFDHPAIVPTLSVGKHDSDLVVVTVGPSRHVTVAELIVGARAKGGTLAVEVAAAVSSAVVQGLAAAHQRGLLHGAVHARSVAIDDAGHVKLFDFAVGRALTMAVARGADGALWRGLGGALAPEVALGDAPTPSSDVYAAGALLFTMLNGEPPPGSVHSTPAVERVVRRALDTDPTRRFEDGTARLEALLEAFDDDRWMIADAAELRRVVAAATGVRPPSEGNLDDDTEDLLATLGSAAKNVTPMRPSVDLRVAQAAARRDEKNVSFGLDTLLADLDEPAELTAVDAAPSSHDPISEIIRLDEKQHQQLEQRDITPLPPPQPFGDDGDADEAHGKGKSRKASLTMPARPRAQSPVVAQLGARADDTQGKIEKKIDEAAALSAISDLEPPSEVAARRARSSNGGGVRRATSDLDSELADIVDALPEEARTPAPVPVAKPPPAKPMPKPAAPAPRPVVARDDLELAAVDTPPVRLKNPLWGVLWIVLIAGGVGAGIYYYFQQKEGIAAHELAEKEKQTESSNAA